MRERVHLCGGTFDAGPLPGGGFEVTAALPLPLPPAGAPAWGDGAAAAGGEGAVRATGAAVTPGVADPVSLLAREAAAVRHGGRADISVGDSGQ
jgi:hypothetical protein